MPVLDVLDHIDRHHTRRQRRPRCPACFGRCGVVGGARNDCRIGQYDTLANLGLVPPRQVRFNMSTVPTLTTQPIRPGRHLIADLTPTTSQPPPAVLVGESRLFEVV